MTNDESPPLTLRRLPLPIKLVVSVFLISVGLGYGSALVQLHFQHGSPGNALPTPEDVIEHFSGDLSFIASPEAEGKPKEEPMSKIVRLVSADESLPFNSNGQMKAAFFSKSGGWKEGDAELRNQRDTEWRAFLAWAKSSNEVRRETYLTDAFPLPENLADRVIPEDFEKVDDDGNLVEGVIAIQWLIETRCIRCHKSGDTDPDYSVPEIDDLTLAFNQSYDRLEPYLEVPKPSPSGVVKSSRQISVEALTQSTHAHLLSFSMLFALTGLVFALSSYPRWSKLILAPMVLIAQMADIACWWLARLDGVGPYFALTIIATGAVVGIGLFLQITLSLFNLYGWTGKSLLFVLVLAFGGGLYVLGEEVIVPQLEAEKASLKQRPESQPANDEPGQEV